MPRETESTRGPGIEATKMRHELNILHELFLPYLEDLATAMPQAGEQTVKDEAFWARFNDAIINSDEPAHAVFVAAGVEYSIPDTVRFADLKNEYLVYLAQCYCLGQSNPSITLLLSRADVRFDAEIAFQKDLLTAMTIAGRADIKQELKDAEEFDDTALTDDEIKTAFRLLHNDSERDELKRQLQQWDMEKSATPAPVKRKKRRALPLLFLRFAAAAAVCTVTTVGIVKLYNAASNDKGHATEHRSDTVADSTAGTSIGIDTPLQNITPVAPPENPADVSTRSKSTTSKPPDTAAGIHKAAVTHAPLIVLKGTIVDVATNDLVTGVTVTMTDEKGNKQSVYSADGAFSFTLPLHRDLVITGKKNNYVSARLSLSTKDVKDSDGDDVINGTLRLSREP